MEPSVGIVTKGRQGALASILAMAASPSARHQLHERRKQMLLGQQQSASLTRTPRAEIKAAMLTR